MTLESVYAECGGAVPGGGVLVVVEECGESLGAKQPLRYMEVYYPDSPGGLHMLQGADGSLMMLKGCV